jgi:hypothetical protein
MSGFDSPTRHSSVTLSKENSMNSKQIQNLRDAFAERRSAALAAIANEMVSKFRYRMFLEHACSRCEVGTCRYSYEVMAADAEVQVDALYEIAIAALDLAEGILEESGEFPSWATNDLRSLDRDFLKVRMSSLDLLLERLHASYDFWLGLGEDTSEVCEFDMA